MIPEILPVELADLLKSPRPPRLLDVREEDELEISQLPGAVNIPLSELAERYPELDPAADYVVICRSGKRSLRAIEMLSGVGFANLRNLATGINGWADTVDPTLEKY